ncbi:hypothetical protein PARPLA_01834 [Rhodobacteraceae bacterium THAF1]|uniref:hypothetical protein n=1 Tax=Palleronia sp. THAF1 TaxID=2587842 RepID=UPI000F3BA1A5|nr:hypothetical protein [Palleronia sp. THAF1]QFU09031.1 hypothetical protein FIU81_10130 [Palleronia sp. THAF1]VDC24207.1 hypothetical protein PARPLA_01834 [Rhodobacteraceae bacterium THAF1]
MRPLIQFPAALIATVCKLIPRSGAGIAVSLTILCAGVNLANDADIGLSFLNMQASADVSSEWTHR